MRVSKNNFNKPLSLALGFSNTIRWGVTLIHLLVAGAIVASGLGVIDVFLLLLVLSSYLYYYQWHVTQSLKKSIVTVKLSSTGDWSLVNSQSTLITVTLLPTSFFSKYLLVLNFHSREAKKYTVLIPKGRINSNDFRQIKVWLKTKKAPLLTR